VVVRYEKLHWYFGNKVMEHDLPLVSVTRIAKQALPTNAGITKEAKDALQTAAGIFILYLTSAYVEPTR
jgi:histone H3/H4